MESTQTVCSDRLRQPYLKTLVLLGALGLSLLVPSLLPKMANAQPLGTCNGPGGHCYGYTNWSGAVHGSVTEFQTVPLYSANTSNFIDNEMWDIDTVHLWDGVEYSEVGTGESTWLGRTGNWYFYAYELPVLGMRETPLYQPPSGDVGNYMEYDVTISSISGYYQITMINTVTNNAGFQETFSAEGTVPTQIQVGQESTNNSCSVNTAQTAYYQSNEWQDLHNYWHYQTNGGQPYSDYPPTWNWLTVPANGNYGGFGETYSC